MAARVLRRAVVLRPNDRAARYELTLNLSRSMARKGDKAGAKASYDEATTLAPGAGPAPLNPRPRGALSELFAQNQA